MVEKLDIIIRQKTLDKQTELVNL